SLEAVPRRGGREEGAGGAGGGAERLRDHELPALDRRPRGASGGGRGQRRPVDRCEALIRPRGTRVPSGVPCYPARRAIWRVMVRAIVTHPGGAHKDDLLAVCVLIAEHGAPVARREPTPEDLEDPEVAVVDVGGVHDPARSNFDHHQFPREHPPTCALSLVLDGMGLYEDARHFCDWLEPAEWFDSRGPKKTAEWLGVPRQAIAQLNSPIDVTLLRRFAAKTELAAGDPLY